MTGGALRLPPLEAVDHASRAERIAALAHLGELQERVRASLERDGAAAPRPTRRVDPARVLSAKRVGELLGLSTYTVQEMIRRRELPSVAVRGGRRGVRHVALVRVLEAAEAGLAAPLAGAYTVAHDTNGIESASPAPRALAKRARKGARRGHDDGSPVGARRAPDQPAHGGDPETPSADAFRLPRGGE